MSEIKLKPCPFCGGETVYITKSNVSEHHCVGFDFKVGCEDCEMSLPGRYKIRFSLSENGEPNVLTDERPIAAEKWNKRIGQDDEEHGRS